MSTFDRDRIRQLGFILILLLLGGIIFYKLTPFFSGFLGALTLYVLLLPQMKTLTRKHRWPKALAATVLIIEAFVVLLIPAGLIVELLFNKITNWSFDSSQIKDGLQNLANHLQSFTWFHSISEHALNGAQQFLTSLFQNLINTTYGLAMNVLMLCFFLYFMLTNMDWLDRAARVFLPLSEGNSRLLMEESHKMVVSNAIGIPLIAVIQGLIASLGYYIFGVSDALFWGIITGFMSILPIVGGSIIWIPMCIYLFISAEPWQGLGLAVFSLVIITNTDNLIRFILQKKMADVHPLITVLGVIIGISLFGFLGIIFGPLLISAFILLFKIYRKEYVADQQPEMSESI